MQKQKAYDFDKVANRSQDFSKKWCPKKATERFGKIPCDYISMWIADMDFEIAPAIANRFQRIMNNKTFGYIYCYDDFFKAVKLWNEAKTGIPIAEDTIKLSYGVVSSLYCAVQAFCQAGKDCILINTPVYNPFRECAESNNVDIIENQLYIDEANHYRIDFASLEAQLKEHRPKLYIFCSPHNPSGHIWSQDEVEKIAELCLKYGVILVADEVHSDHIRKGPFFSTLSLPAKYRNNLIYLNSANKGFNFAGLKTSYSIITSKCLSDTYNLQLQKNHIDEPNVFGIAAIVAAYSDEGADWLQACYSYICDNYAYAEQFIAEKCPQLRLMEMESSYLLWLDVTETGMTGDEFTMKLALETGVLFQEGSSFGTGGENYVRVNIGTSKTLVKEALNRMHKWLQKNQ